MVVERGEKIQLENASGVFVLSSDAAVAANQDATEAVIILNKVEWLRTKNNAEQLIKDLISI